MPMEAYGASPLPSIRSARLSCWWLETRVELQSVAFIAICFWLRIDGSTSIWTYFVHKKGNSDVSNPGRNTE